MGSVTKPKKKASMVGTSERGAKTKKKAARSVRKATRKKGNYKAGPGRPLGSKKDETGLTPNQKGIAQAMLEAELTSGMFPATVREVADVTGKDPKTVRNLLKRKEFQDYLFSLLELEGVVLEGAFWRSMALGLQVGDSKVMQLYANMTGKIEKKEDKKIEVVITAPEGHTLALPVYEGDAAEIVDAETVDEAP